MSWYLLNTRPYKRDLFLKYLERAINEQQLQELICQVSVPKDAVYQDLILVQLRDFSKARPYLQKIEYFQHLEPKALSTQQVQRLSGLPEC